MSFTTVHELSLQCREGSEWSDAGLLRNWRVMSGVSVDQYPFCDMSNTPVSHDMNESQESTSIIS